MNSRTKIEKRRNILVAIYAIAGIIAILLKDELIKVIVSNTQFNIEMTEPLLFFYKIDIIFLCGISIYWVFRNAEKKLREAKNSNDLYKNGGDNEWTINW